MSYPFNVKLYWLLFIKYEIIEMERLFQKLPARSFLHLNFHAFHLPLQNYSYTYGSALTLKLLI